MSSKSSLEAKRHFSQILHRISSAIRLNREEISPFVVADASCIVFDFLVGCVAFSHQADWYIQVRSQANPRSHSFIIVNVRS